MSAISGFIYPGHDKNIFQEDFVAEQSAISYEIIERWKKVFGTGVIFGGAVTISGTALKVDVAEMFAFDEDGKIVYFPTQTAQVTLAEGTNHIVARHKFIETEYNQPFSDGQVSVHRTNSFELIARTSAPIAGDIPLRTVTMASGVRTLSTDLRTFAPLQAKINRIDELGTDPKGSFADIATRLQYLDNYLKVGKLEWFDQHFAPDASNPWFALSNADAVLDAANWPDLVPYWRAKKLKYMPGTGSEKSAFDVTHYTRASNVVTITLANTTAELAILAALAEENLVHGSFSSWIPLYLPVALGSNDVPIGDYAITAIDAIARTISFSHIGSNIGSTAVSRTVEFYPHRISGSTTTCRHYQIRGRTFVSPNDSDGEVIPGLRRRDRGQGHWHVVFREVGAGGNNGMAGLAQFVADSVDNSERYGTAASIITDGINGTHRVGKTTDPRSLGAVPYIWARRYAA